MAIVIPSTIRGLVCDLENTLVRYPETENPKPDYIPLPDSLDFLNRAEKRFGQSTVLIFTTASVERCHNACSIALQGHKALQIGLWVTGVMKPVQTEFNLSALAACERIGFDKYSLAYIDDSPTACFYALLFGFQFVICLSDFARIEESLDRLDATIASKVSERFDGDLFYQANSLSEIEF